MCVKEAPLTRTTLLIPVKNEADAWQGFVRFYGPVIYRFARKQGLRDVGAADLMREVLRSAPGYDRGTFRDGLFTVTRDKIGSFLSKNRGAVADGSRVRSLSALKSDWDTQYERQLTVAAMNRVKPEFQSVAWQAFWKAAVEGRPAHDVSRELKMTPGTVYVVKSQVLARLNEEVQRLRDEAEPWQAPLDSARVRLVPVEHADWE
jgi:RNA polymerase sigma-70 factor (ECF subfamily)